MARFCLTPRCGELVSQRDYYCDTHRPKVEPWRGSKSQARGWAWSKRRVQILKRDAYTCTEPGCTRPATDVDAIVPSAEGGSHEDPSNLRSLCKPHHRSKTEADRLRGLRRARET